MSEGLDRDDVARSILRLERSAPSAAHPNYITRWLSRVFLLSTPTVPDSSTSHAWSDDGNGGDGRKFGSACDNRTDIFDNRSRARLKRRRRNLFIIWSSFVTSIVVLAYAFKVDDSWRQVESRWAMMAQLDASPGASHGTSTSVPVTRLWAHSHNDEMHGDGAFTTALGLGFGSIEADTYLVTQHDGSKALMVGHEKHDLRAGRTLQSVYLDPILHILNKRNQDRSSNASWVGLLADDPHAEVQLVLDFKDDGPGMWPFILEALEPLHRKGYLTTYSQKTQSFNRGPLMIIGTGETPLSHVYYLTERVIFYDAPLRKLHKPARIPSSSAGPAVSIQLDHSISPMASAKLPPLAHIGLAFYPAPNPILRWMKKKTAEARRRGVTSRWWGAANKPKWVRRRVWAMMREAHTDWINGDNLHDLARWSRRMDDRS